MTIDQNAMNALFNEARTANGFIDKAVPTELLHKVYDLAKMGSTSMNCQPARYIFLTTPAAKERVLPAMSPGNLDKTKGAPVTVIIATDNQFYENMPKVFPNKPDAKEMFAGNAGLAAGTATRNGTLGSAYFMIAARALGLDCGAMSGFDAAKVNAEFFPDGRLQANYLINLGYMDTSKLFGRNPRLSFEQATQVL
jgi:3-hydroxypropanoate dehydrogenase